MLNPPATAADSDAMRARVAEERADDSQRIDSRMMPEAHILGDDDRVLQMLRYLVERDRTAILELIAQDRGQHDATPVDQPARDHAAGEEAQHVHRVGKRNVGAAHAEIGLHDRQGHDEAPHADAAHRAQGHADGKPSPGVR